MLRLGINASFLGATAKAKLKSESYVTKNNLAVELTQSYFTASVEYPGDALGFVNLPLATGYEFGIDRVGTISPVYVSSVNYGRMLVLLISSSSSVEDLSAAVEASANFLIGSADAKIDLNHQKILSQAEIHVLATGGPAGSFVGLVDPTSARGLVPFLKAGEEFGPASGAMPISYTLRYLKDGSIARVKQTAEIELPPSPIKFEGLKALFHTRNDNKDDNTGVIVEIYEGDRLVGRSDVAGVGENWEDWDKDTNGKPKEVPVKLFADVFVGKEYEVQLLEVKNNSGWKFTCALEGEAGGGTRVFGNSGHIEFGGEHTEQTFKCKPQ